MHSTNDQEELVVNEFLSFLAKGRPQPLDSALLNEVEDLVRGVEVDINSALNHAGE